MEKCYRLYPVTKSKRLYTGFLLLTLLRFTHFSFVTKPYPTVTNVPIMQIIIPIGLFSAIIMPIPIKKITPIIAVNKSDIECVPFLHPPISFYFHKSKNTTIFSFLILF